LVDTEELEGLKQAVNVRELKLKRVFLQILENFEVRG
jgi:hypothetical protein